MYIRDDILRNKKLQINFTVLKNALYKIEKGYIEFFSGNIWQGIVNGNIFILHQCKRQGKESFVNLFGGHKLVREAMINIWVLSQ